MWNPKERRPSPGQQVFVSETEFQRKLNHAWTCRSRDDPSDVRRFDDIERIGEADHVKCIEELRTELEVFAFGHRKALDGRDIGVLLIRSAQEVPPGIAEISYGRGGGETGGVKEFIQPRLHAAAESRIAPDNQIGPRLDERSGVGQYRKWSAALQSDNRSQLPPVYGMPRERRAAVVEFR
jgi:hypothetical protein